MSEAGPRAPTRDPGGARRRPGTERSPHSRHRHRPSVDRSRRPPSRGDDDGPPSPSWWHRSHPTFAGLVGFFTGVAFVIIVPGVYGALLSLLLGDTTPSGCSRWS